MNCVNHPSVIEGIEPCAQCARGFCSDCLVVFQGRRICGECKVEQLIDIRSGKTNNERVLAGVGRRFAAVTFDSLLLQIPLALAFPTATGLPALIALVTRPNWSSWITVGVLIVPMVYEGSFLHWRGQTLGKMALGIKVTQRGGQKLSGKRSWIRAVTRGLFANVLNLIDYIPGLFTKEKTCIHDMAAQSRVLILPVAVHGCPRCQKPIDITRIATSLDAVCPECGRTFEAIHFDPPPRHAAVPERVGSSLDAQQPCAIHTHNVAIAGCQRCGTFMCSLCRTEMDGRTLCPSCFDRLAGEGALETTRTSFRDYPGLARAWATMGCLITFFGFLLGPLAIYYAVKALKQKRAFGENDGVAWMYLIFAVGTIEVVIGLFFLASLFMTTRGMRF